MGNPRFRPSPNCEVWLPKSYTETEFKAERTELVVFSRVLTREGISEVRRAHGAEFHGEKHPVPAALESAPQQHLVVAHAIEIAGIQQVDSSVDGCVDGGDALCFIGRPVPVGRIFPPLQPGE